MMTSLIDVLHILPRVSDWSTLHQTTTRKHGREEGHLRTSQPLVWAFLGSCRLAGRVGAGSPSLAWPGSGLSVADSPAPDPIHPGTLLFASVSVACRTEKSG